uniref:hypothetical protein n=1 Tax=Nocardia farcinica TaxID=37329 RepID=UPI00245570C9
MPEMPVSQPRREIHTARSLSSIRPIRNTISTELSCEALSPHRERKTVPLLRPLLALTAPVGVMLLGTGTASALSVSPAADAVVIEFAHAEAQVITNLNLGPVLGTLPPSFSPLGRQRLGEAIGRGAATAAQTPGSRVIIRVDQPIAA